MHSRKLLAFFAAKAHSLLIFNLVSNSTPGPLLQYCFSAVWPKTDEGTVFSLNHKIKLARKWNFKRRWKNLRRNSCTEERRQGKRKDKVHTIWFYSPSETQNTNYSSSWMFILFDLNVHLILLISWLLLYSSVHLFVDVLCSQIMLFPLPLHLPASYFSLSSCRLSSVIMSNIFSSSTFFTKF